MAHLENASSYRLRDGGDKSGDGGVTNIQLQLFLIFMGACQHPFLKKDWFNIFPYILKKLKILLKIFFHYFLFKC